MTDIHIHEQIAFLRKQKGFTQEELANALGVTNQAVSKWETMQCCPDIQLLPDIAKLFDVSVDVLLGYASTDGLNDICLKIKDYFSQLPKKSAFENAYRLAALLHEAASTDGYKNYIPWCEKEYSIDEVSSWGLSVCSGASGDTELFEKASNINGFQGGRVANNLYISPFRATVFQTAALFLYPNSSVVIRVENLLFHSLWLAL